MKVEDYIKDIESHFGKNSKAVNDFTTHFVVLTERIYSQDDICAEELTEHLKEFENSLTLLIPDKTGFMASTYAAIERNLKYEFNLND
ncbi:MAG: hypothetical protein KBT11_03665 [Treponema sp.]|nr:hypothetical protein [Candidatus Treponema equifaecale]